jgi:lipopolysaccharide heptosyltransferase I
MDPGSDRLRILFVRLSALGDILFALPVFTRLRQAMPEAHITWLVDDRAASLLRGHPDIDELLVFPRKAWSEAVRHPLKWSGLARDARAFLRRLRGGHDIALDVQGNLKSGILTYLSRATRRIGFARRSCREGNWLFTNEHVDPPREKRHRLERDLSLLSALDMEPSFCAPRFPIESENPAVDRLLKSAFPGRNGKAAGRPLIVLHPGTSHFGEFKRWPSDRYGATAHALARSTPCDILVTWGPDEEDLADAVVETSRGAAVKSPPTGSLRQLAALLARADLLVAADTGPLHIAALLGIPVVALFGPKDPDIYAPVPVLAPVAVVRAGVPCSPCKLRKCDLRICMTEIEPEWVVAAALRLLEERIGAADSPAC